MPLQVPTTCSLVQNKPITILIFVKKLIITKLQDVKVLENLKFGILRFFEPRNSITFGWYLHVAPSTALRTAFTHQHFLYLSLFTFLVDMSILLQQEMYTLKMSLTLTHFEK